MADNLQQMKDTLHGIQALKQEVALRLGLLGQARRSGRLELLAALSALNARLEVQYREVRECPARSGEEEACLASIRALEDERFQLLNRLHGAQVKNYGTLPVCLNP